MKASVGEVAHEVSPWKLAGAEVVELFLLPMQRQLAERFSDDSCHLYWDFFDAFWLRSWCQGPDANRRRPAVDLLRIDEADDDQELATGRLSRWRVGTGRPRS